MPAAAGSGTFSRLAEVAHPPLGRGSTSEILEDTAKGFSPMRQPLSHLGSILTPLLVAWIRARVKPQGNLAEDTLGMIKNERDNRLPG